MQIEISEDNQAFIGQVGDKTDLPENVIVNNIISYYRATKTVRRQYLIEPEDKELIEFGKTKLGLLTGDDLQLYLLTYLGQEKRAENMFWSGVKDILLQLIDYVEQNEEQKVKALASSEKTQKVVQQLRLVS